MGSFVTQKQSRNGAEHGNVEKAWPTRDASHELPSSSVPPAIHERRPAERQVANVKDAPSDEPPRCPRCGGPAAPRRRVPNRLNPFLRSGPPSGQITCDDCGLDFGRPPPDSGKAPWSTKDT